MASPICLLLPIALGGAPAGAQLPDAPRATGAVELTVTNLDVVVTDAKGQHVRGLTAADFEVVHDGRTVPVTNLEEYGPAPAGQASAAPSPQATAAGSAPAAEAAPVAAAPSRPRRTVILFVDRIRLPDQRDRETFFGALEDLLRRVVGPADRVMIVAWGRSLRNVVPFTSDPATWQAGLDDLGKAATGLAEETAELDTLSTDAAWFAARAAEAGASSSGVGPTQRLLAAQAYADMKGKTAALQGLISALAGADGRRILVIASHRFSRYAGMEYFLGKRAGLTDGLTFDSKEFDARRFLESVADAANAHGVTLYGLHPESRGEDVTVSAAEAISDYPTIASGVPGGREMLVLGNEAEALGMVAERTGGIVALGPQDVAGALTRVAEDVESYYSIGYVAPPGKPDRAASVKVRVKGRDVTVRTRRALVVRSDESRMKDRVLANLFVREGASRLPITVTAKRKDSGKKDKKRLGLEVHVPIGPLVLTQGPGLSRGSFSVFVAAAGVGGKVSEVTKQTRPFEIPTPQLARARTSSFTYELEVDVTGPETIVSVGVLDEVGKDAGFARIAVLPSR